MRKREPISIKATYTDNNNQLVEKQFRSISQAANFFTITYQSLKELSLGGAPLLHENVPKDLKISRIETLPKQPNIKNSQKIQLDAKWHCDLCNKDIKEKSKYAHVMT